MKKYLIIALLLISATAYGFGGLMMGSGTVVVAAGGVTSGDTLNESFEGTGYENTWTELSGALSNPDATWPITAPSGAGSESFEVATTGGSTSSSYWDNGSTISEIYVRFWMEVDSHDVVDDGDLIEVCEMRNDASLYLMELRLGRASGALQLNLNVRSNTGGTTTYNLAYDDTNIMVEMWWRNGGAGDAWGWKVNGNVVESAGTHTSSYDFQRIYIGARGFTGTSAATIYFDLIGLDTTGWLGE